MNCNGSFVTVLGNADILLPMVLYKFKYQTLVADIVDEVIHGTDVSNSYGFKGDCPEDWPREKKCCMSEMVGAPNHSIKYVLAEEGVNRCRGQEHTVLDICLLYTSRCV